MCRRITETQITRDRWEDSLNFLLVSHSRAFKAVNGNRMQADGGVRLECYPLRRPQPMVSQRARFAFVIKYLPAVNWVVLCFYSNFWFKWNGTVVRGADILPGVPRLPVLYFFHVAT